MVLVDCSFSIYKILFLFASLAFSIFPGLSLPQNLPQPTNKKRQKKKKLSMIVLMVLLSSEMVDKTTKAFRYRPIITCFPPCRVFIISTRLGQQTGICMRENNLETYRSRFQIGEQLSCKRRENRRCVSNRMEETSAYGSSSPCHSKVGEWMVGTASWNQLNENLLRPWTFRHRENHSAFEVRLVFVLGDVWPAEVGWPVHCRWFHPVFVEELLNQVNAMIRKEWGYRLHSKR